MNKHDVISNEVKVSFVTTCFNEEKNIEEFLQSLFFQTKLPDEIIIVDGGSSDATVGRIRNYELGIKNTNKIKIKLIIKKGNRSVGRNEGIKHATHNVIAVSDVGCFLEKEWLKEISTPFKDSAIDVVAGFYYPKTNSVFEECLATYTCVMKDKLNKKTYLPSSRSIAFRKNVWQQVKGYPEFLDTCEDLVFAKKIRDAGFTVTVNDNAIVYWPQRKNIWEAFLQFYRYAVGDGMAKFFRKQTPFLFLRFIIFVSLFFFALLFHSKIILLTLEVLICLYILYAIVKNIRYVPKPQALLYLPLLQVTSDIAVFLGTTIGFIKGQFYEYG